MKKHPFLKIALSFLLTVSTVSAEGSGETRQEEGRLILKDLHERRFKKIGNAETKLARGEKNKAILSNHVVNATPNGKTVARTLAATGPQRVLETRVSEVKKTPMLSQKLSVVNKAWAHAAKQKAVLLHSLLNETFLVAQRYRELDPSKQSASMKKNVIEILVSLSRVHPVNEAEKRKLSVLKKMFSGQNISEHDLQHFEASSHPKDQLPFAENVKNS